MASYYRNLEVWKKSFELNQKIFILLKKFPQEERFALVDQMRRSAISIPSNIAEWSWRWTEADSVRFYHIAKWSAMELETQILLAESFDYIDSEKTKEILDMIDEINKMLHGMVRKNP